MSEKLVFLEKAGASLLICIFLIFQVSFGSFCSHTSCIEYFTQKGVSAEAVCRVIEAVEKAGFKDIELALAVIYVESGFDPFAVGNDGERGLMQITNDALKEVVRFFPEIEYRPDKLFEINYNVLVGCRYLEICSKRAKTYLPEIYSDIGHLANTVMFYKDGTKWRFDTFVYAKKVTSIYRQIRFTKWR